MSQNLQMDRGSIEQLKREGLSGSIRFSPETIAAFASMSVKEVEADIDARLHRAKISLSEMLADAGIIEDKFSFTT